MLVGQVTDFDSVGVAAGAGAVPQVSVFAANRCHWGGGCIYVFLVVCFLHCAACGRRRMSPSARHKQGLVRQDRNPGFRSGNLYFL